MKYQHIIDNRIVFQTNNVTEYINYLLQPQNISIVKSILIESLDDKHTSEEMTTDYAHKLNQAFDSLDEKLITETFN